MRKLVLASILVIVGSIAFMASAVNGEGGTKGRAVIIGPGAGQPGGTIGFLSPTTLPCTVSVLSAASGTQLVLVPNAPGGVTYIGFQDLGFRQDQYPGFKGVPGFDVEDLFQFEECP